MNPSVKASLLTLAISAMFAPVNGNAAEVPQIIASSAMAHCQAFTPGVTNTIRNRVIGSENVGNPLSIACAFEVDAGAMTADQIQSILLFLNNHSTASFDIPCTAAVGPEGAFSYFISKTTTVAPGEQSPVEFTPADGGSSDIGFNDYLIGLTCTLPKGGVVNDTYVAYAIDNGV
ncbi:MAG TPA: hypothetical protein VFI32_10330 [Rhodanobacteraceae bacterium]|jgi:hypothetical protein|nr:hypothetical protein [Rhodanobacteraceae bacterium]